LPKPAGRQARLVFGEGANSAGIGGTGLLAQRPRPLPPRLSTEDLSHHRVFVDTLGTTPLWNRYFSQDDPAKKVKQA
jgi:hypothetical protein